MRSSRHIIHRPYIPGGLVLRDLTTVLKRQRFSKPGGVTKKPRQFYIDFVRAYSDPNNTSLSLWQTESSPKKRVAQWRPAPLRGPAMRWASRKGEKRKQESCDGDFYPRKIRLLDGGEARAVSEEEMARDDEETPEIVYPEGGFLARELADWPDTVKELPPQGLLGLEEKIEDKEFDPMKDSIGWDQNFKDEDDEAWLNDLLGLGSKESSKDTDLSPKDLPGLQEGFEDEDVSLEDVPGSEENFEDDDVSLKDAPVSEEDFEDDDVSLKDVPGLEESFEDEDIALEDVPGSEENFQDDDDVSLKDVPASEENFQDEDLSLEDLPGEDEDFEDVSSEMSCTMDNLSIMDVDDTAMHTPYTSKQTACIIPTTKEDVKQTVCIIPTTKGDTVKRTPNTSSRAGGDAVKQTAIPVTKEERTPDTSSKADGDAVKPTPDTSSKADGDAVKQTACTTPTPKEYTVKRRTCTGPMNLVVVFNNP